MAKSKPTARSISVVLHPEVVMSRTSLDHDAIVAGVRAGTFPKPRLLHGQVVWNETDVSAWITAQVDQGLMREPPLSPAVLELVDALAKDLVQDFLAEQCRSESK